MTELSVKPRQENSYAWRMKAELHNSSGMIWVASGRDITVIASTLEEALREAERALGEPTRSGYHWEFTTRSATDVRLVDRG